MEAGGLDVTQALLGHASITSTQIYLHPRPRRLREAVQRLATQRVPSVVVGPRS